MTIVTSNTCFETSCGSTFRDVSAFRRAGALAACLVAALVLTGCSPAIRGIIGIQRTGESFTVIAATCEGITLGTAQLLDLSQVNDKSEYVTVREWSMQGADQGVRRTDEFATAEFLSFLGQGAFRLWGEDAAFIRNVVAGPEFTRADLLTLTEGEVLTVDSKDFEEVVLADGAEMSASLDLPSCK